MPIFLYWRKKHDITINNTSKIINLEILNIDITTKCTLIKLIIEVKNISNIYKNLI